ncbi:MAG: arsenite methyltransferase [Candidatus Neomarinimicrobiota bacterium]
METSTHIKEIVKEKYGTIAKESDKENGCGCCGDSKKTVEYSFIGDDYSQLDGYSKEADLGLGCGLPTQFADLKKGNTVVDLGAGAGNDVFVARSIVGDAGKVIGIDMTEEMIELANKNKDKLGYENIDFRLGEIEDLPVDEDTTDVVISNCVLNLVPDKEKAFSEIHRILKKDGHFCISDIVLKGDIPEVLKKSAEMYAGCVAGALQKDEYIKTIHNAGFKNVEIKQSKTITIPDEILNKFLTEEQLAQYNNSGIGIYSITVVGEK